MKKSLLAVAVAAALPAVAHAQSSITMYGIVDVGVEYINDQAAGFQSSNGLMYLGNGGVRVTNGILTGSRLGFRGVEPLANGWKALFTIEHRFSPDTGVQTDGKFWNAQAWVGLETGLGTVMLGRQYTPIFWALLPVDFSNYTYYNNWAGYNGAGTSTLVGNMSPQGPIRLDNAIQYKSPTFGGLTVWAVYAPGERLSYDQTSADNQANPGLAGCKISGCVGSGDVWGVAGQWRLGGLILAGGYHAIQNKAYSANATPSAPTADDVAVLAASYDFGKFGVSLGYSMLGFNQSLNTFNNTANTPVVNWSPKVNTIMFSSYLSIGPGKLYLNAHQSDPKDFFYSYKNNGVGVAPTVVGASNKAGLQLGLAYGWFVSNRTTLYVAAGMNQVEGLQPQIANQNYIDNQLRLGVGINHKF